MKNEIFNEQIRRMQKLAGILKENYNPELLRIAEDVAGPFSSYILPGSIRYTYGPDENGSYHMTFQLAFDPSNNESPTELEDELQNQIGGSSYSGPGQAYSKTNVSYDRPASEAARKDVFQVLHRAGYDI